MGAFPSGVPMKSKKLALSAASLTLVLSFLACNVPGSGGGTPTFIISETTAPAGPAVSTPAPGVPTNTDGAETIVIPGGTFWMGSEVNDALADEDEMPRHLVTLETFPIYTHEVTNAMYARCVEAGGCTPIQVLEAGPTSHYGDPAFAGHPVVGVDWNMADDYCTWAGARLPTEAEWEYAARGADSLPYPWGSEGPTCDRLNMADCLTPADTVQVGSYANGNSPFGVWDMSGNAWEWTHDWYDRNSYAFADAIGLLGPNLPEDPANPQKVVRGGGMNSDPAAVRTASRIGARPLRAYDDVGFRCVAQPPLDLPADYAHVPDGHEFVPPGSLDGGGERVEEPGEGTPWAVVLSPGHFSCPDPEGRIHLTLNADSSIDPTTFSASVGGAALDCSFDPAARKLSCSMLPPAGYDTWGDHVPIRVCFEHAYGARCVDLLAVNPTDCPGEGATPLELTASVGCPEGDLVTATFSYDRRMEWDFVAVETGSLAHDIPCWGTSGTSLECQVRARAPGETYHFILQGRDEDGRMHFETAAATIPADCGSTMRTLEIYPVCLGREPAIDVRVTPEPPWPISISVPGGPPMICVHSAPGRFICRTLPGEPGSTTTVRTCFVGEACGEWPVRVPDCSGGTAVREVEVYGVCLGREPTVDLRVSPEPWPIQVSAPGVSSMLCIRSAPGRYLCQGLPGDAGSMTPVTTCFADEPCQEWTVRVPDCSGDSTAREVEVYSICLGSEPAIDLRVSPEGWPTTVSAPGTSSMLCVRAAPGRYLCRGLPGDAGAMTTVTTCIADDPCQEWPVRVSHCGEEEEPSEGEFRLAGVGCHDETHIFFIVDTGLAWLVPGAAYTYSAVDADHGYSCSVHPTIAGRLYCSGGRPVSPGTLNVCINQDGPDPMICESFADWPAQAASIPDCAPEEPPSGSFSCSDITDPLVCNADPRCKWVMLAPPGVCVPE